MEWIVKIEQTEEEKPQRIRVVFNPMAEEIHFYGEARVKNNQWFVFSEFIHIMEITLEQLQEMMEKAVVTMRKRLKEYENLDKGFSVLKKIGFEEDQEQD
jgi:hypothetical protein